MTNLKQEYPFTLQFGIVDGCNMNCEFCGMRGRKREVHYTDTETVDRLLIMMSEARFSGRVRLDLYGEPTLHPGFFEIVQKVHQALPKSHITLFTNGYGVYKKGHKIDEYFSAGVGDIIFDVYANTLDDFKASGVENHPLACVNGPCVPFFVKNNRVLINMPIEDQQDIKTRKFVNHCGAGAPALTQSLCARCAHPFREFTVNSWGEIMLCCNDFRGEYLVGNIQNFNTFEEAWNSPRLESARLRLYHRDREFNPCNKCNSKSHRVGLLPDHLGKQDLPEASEDHRQITEYPYHSQFIIPKSRNWEETE
jgi:radical SAM protein with 4Fe4S-binding SPASM domain